ncbi:MAG TPA: adenylate/guanylate cyclase domain-containing protein [bacterium]|nr:adenylate/guanylate cyclase domain-containing protein [bacterium]
MKKLFHKLSAVKISLAAAAAVLLLYVLNPAFLAVIELKTLDLRFQLRGKTDPGGEIAIVTIDDRSLDKLGRWPWPRAYIADAVRYLKDSGAAVIGFDILFTEPDRNTALATVEKLAEAFASSGLDAETAAGKAFAERLEAEKHANDNDAALADAFAYAGNVILPMYFTLPGEKGAAATPEELKRIKPLLDRSAYALVKKGIDDPRYLPLEAVNAENSIGRLAAAAACEGAVNIIPDRDGSLRHELFAVGLSGDYYPSLTLQLARAYLGAHLSETKFITSDSVLLKDTVIPLTIDNRLLINYCGPNETFPYYSFVDVKERRIPPEKIKGKIVIFGAIAAGLGDLKITPYSPLLPGVEKHANVVQNILHNNFLRWNAISAVIDGAAIILLALCLGLFMTKTSALRGIAISLGMLAGYCALAQLSFSHLHMIVNVVYPILSMIVSYTGVTAFKLLTEEKEKRKIKDIFKHYAAEQVVNQLLANPESVKLGGEKRTITILFCDIESFTAISESLDPQDMAALLNKYLTAMTRVVFRHGGTVDKFMGDSIMVLFSAPLAFPDHARRASLVALDMLKVVDALQEEWTAKTGRRLNTRIGINTGTVVVGNMGSEELMDYTAIGDAVNLAQRLEQLNKEYGTTIIIGENTFRELGDSAIVRELGTAKVKGKNQLVQIYELKGLKDTSR